MGGSELGGLADRPGDQGDTDGVGGSPKPEVAEASASGATRPGRPMSADSGGDAEKRRVRSESFPTPGMALRTNDRSAQERIRQFAVEQTVAANDTLVYLDQQLVEADTPEERERIFDEAYGRVCSWRHKLALRPNTDGGVVGRSAEKFLTLISDEFPPGPNLDRIGRIGRFYEGANWDEELKTYVGGVATPASSTAEQVGDYAQKRFEHEAPDSDVLQNLVAVEDPRRGHVLVKGNFLLRGEAAQDAAQELLMRQEAKGLSTRGFDVGRELMYIKTASVDSRTRLHQAAMRELAQLETQQNTSSLYPHDTAAHDAFVNAAYLLYQSPQYKRGSDAVARTFLASAYTRLFNYPPCIPSDIDMQAYVRSQDDFVQQMRGSL